jgi:transposase
MITKKQFNEREQLEMLTIDQLVPEDHLVRKLDSAIDFSFIYPLVENLYSGLGRPSIDPMVLFKMKGFLLGTIVNTYKIKQIYARCKETIERVLQIRRKSMVCDGDNLTRS